MNYYEHHLGDWAAATGHLTWDEDMAYTRLLRSYYHAEKAIPQGQQYRMAKATTPGQRKAVDAVIAEFFELREGHFHQKRADAEIARFKDKQGKAKASANARWSNTGRNANASADAMRTHSEGNAHHTPDTIHQSPDPNTHTTTRAGCVGLLLRRAGLQDANTGHPTLLALIDAGCTDAEFSGAATEAVKRGKGFAYAIGMLRRQREDVASTVLHFGQMPEVMTPGQAAAQARIAAVSPSLLARKPAPVTTTTAEVIDVATRRLG